MHLASAGTKRRLLEVFEDFQFRNASAMERPLNVLQREERLHAAEEKNVRSQKALTSRGFFRVPELLDKMDTVAKVISSIALIKNGIRPTPLIGQAVYELQKTIKSPGVLALPMSRESNPRKLVARLLEMRDVDPDPQGTHGPGGTRAKERERPVEPDSSVEDLIATVQKDPQKLRRLMANPHIQSAFGSNEEFLKILLQQPGVLRTVFNDPTVKLGTLVSTGIPAERIGAVVDQEVNRTRLMGASSPTAPGYKPGTPEGKEQNVYGMPKRSQDYPGRSTLRDFLRKMHSYSPTQVASNLTVKAFRRAHSFLVNSPVPKAGYEPTIKDPLSKFPTHEYERSSRSNEPHSWDYHKRKWGPGDPFKEQRTWLARGLRPAVGAVRVGVPLVTSFVAHKLINAAVRKGAQVVRELSQNARSPQQVYQQQLAMQQGMMPPHGGYPQGPYYGQGY